MTRRLDLVMAATRILLENITYSEPVAMQRYARLLARELAAWVIVDVERRPAAAPAARERARGPARREAGHAVAAVDPAAAVRPATRCTSRAARC